MTTGGRADARKTGPARHERPDIDDAALVAARAADRALAAARERGAARWVNHLAPVPDLLRDGDLRDLRPAAMRVRASYGPKDSIRDTLPEDVTEPLLDATDRLLRMIARREHTSGL